MICLIIFATMAPWLPTWYEKPEVGQLLAIIHQHFFPRYNVIICRSHQGKCLALAHAATPLGRCPEGGNGVRYTGNVWSKKKWETS